MQDKQIFKLFHFNLYLNYTHGYILTHEETGLQKKKKTWLHIDAWLMDSVDWIIFKA